MKKLSILITFLFVTACQVESAADETEQNERKVMNGAKEVVVGHPPERAVTMNQHVTEIMLALGLEDRMVGTAYLDDVIHSDYKEAYESVPVLADGYPSKENILAVEPDFIYAGWKSAFQDEAAGGREELEKYGISTYLHESSNMQKPQLDDLYQDIHNIGILFDEEEVAEALVAEMKAEMEKAKELIPEDNRTKKVFVYDSGEDAPLTAAQNILNTLIEHAEAENIFGEIEKGWATVSWEDVAKSNPDEMIIMDYGETSMDDKITFLENHPAMKEVKAVKNEEYTIIPLSEASEGIRTPDAFKKIVDGLYNE